MPFFYRFLLVFLMGLPMLPATAQTPKPEIKALARDPGKIYRRSENSCTLQIRFNQEDFLASLTSLELKEALKAAEEGDSDAMYFLAQIPKADESVERSYPYRNEWLPKAIAAGHPLARFQEARRLHEKFEALLRHEFVARKNYYYKSGYVPVLWYSYALLTQTHPQLGQEVRTEEFLKTLPAEELQLGREIAQKVIEQEPEVRQLLPLPQYLALAKEAALADGSGLIAWELADAYHGWGPSDVGPHFFKGQPFIDHNKRSYTFLPNEGNEDEARRWTLVAAERNNVAAAAKLCLDFSNFGGRPKKYPDEALRWCSVAAQAPCNFRLSISGASILAGMYEDGFAVPKSRIDALYWWRIRQGFGVPNNNLWRNQSQGE